jgi:UDP-N-acetylglucosamine 2-epimerase (non-hydrolysing)
VTQTHQLLNSHQPRLKVAAVIGTRPEAIKMAPIIWELQRRDSDFSLWIISTAQHHELLDDALRVFNIRPDNTLNLMRPDQTVPDLASRALVGLTRLLASRPQDIVLVQGDTTTVVAATLAAFYLGIKVAHVEAGLRSFNRSCPFPEEMHRRLVGCMADLHFAPTERARQNLLREGVPPKAIFVTGNTIVDALRSVALGDGFEDPALEFVDTIDGRLLLVTAHRRENHGAALRSICESLKSLVASFDDVQVVFPVHPNPRVCDPVRRHLSGIPRIHLVNPVSYHDLLQLIRRSTLVLTDSGGIQEEAPSFQKPVLVMRDTTERPELLDTGAGQIVGTSTATIVAAVTRLLEDPLAYRAMQATVNPFGDGRAAERIANILRGVNE